ncbi:MAG: DNA adenine methylase, partial [Pseudomonadota bacterium]
EELIAELAGYRYDRELYYQVREWDRREDFKSISPVRRAARFVFLNKTCFNGLHRVNSKGHFNVPFGRYSDPRILDRDGLKRCSQALQGVEIEIGSYTSVAERVERGDLVYFDPPYVPLSDTSSFTSYAKGGFSADDQVTLRDLCVELDRRGVMFVLSNSDNHTTRELYRAFRVDTVPAARAINSKASRRGAVDEVIVANF